MLLATTPPPRASADLSRLEVFSAVPPAPTFETPILFVHGAYTAAWCWQEHFLGYFADAGFASHAVSLRGHGGSRGRRALDSFSIDDYVADVAAVAASLPTPPLLVGHSMGGFVVQRLLEHEVFPGAVLMCSVPPQGLMASAVGLLFRKPDMMGDLNRMLGGNGAGIDTLREALFAQPVAPEDLKRYFRHSQLESQRAIWDMTLPGMPDHRRITRTPLRVVGAELDHLIPPSMVEATARHYGVPATIFAGMGHGLMLERDWTWPAQTLLEWFTGHQP
jgi:non-heme chloroperoxidase